MILEPVQNSGGCLPPPPGYFQRVREICDRHGVLLISDDTICGWGRLGKLVRRAAVRPRARSHHHRQGPDLRLCAHGRRDRLRARGRPVPRAGPSSRTGSRSAAIPWPRRSRWPTSTRSRARTCSATSAGTSPRCAARLDALRATPAGRRRARRGLLLGDGAGRRPGVAPPVRPEAAHTLCARASSRPELRRRGLICRATDRGYPVIQLAPPLIAGPEQFDEIGAVLHDVLTLACERMGMG